MPTEQPFVRTKPVRGQNPDKTQRYYTDPVYRAEKLKRRKEHYWANREAKIEQVKKWREANPDRIAIHYSRRLGAKLLWSCAKRRAKKLGIPFDIEISDISIPEGCPALGIKLESNKRHHHDNSPTLDRVIPSLGYVKGNIAVISLRANRIKNDASLLEIEKVASWLNAFLTSEAPVRHPTE